MVGDVADPGEAAGETSEQRRSDQGDDARSFFGAERETFFAEVNMADSNRTWISGRPAVRLSGKNIYMLYKLALTGRLRYQAPPGQSVRFHREDLARLAAEE